MSDNVVQFQKATTQKRGNEASQIKDELERKSRLDRSLPPQLAANLGKLAKRLNPADPGLGARSMFEQAFGAEFHSYWRKRKRVIRLPGEDAPAFQEYGEYDSSGDKYVRLAEAYARLAGQPVSIEQTLFDLVRGTALSPRGPASRADDGLAKHLAQMLQPCLSRLDLMEEVACGFRYLRENPISPWGRETLGKEPIWGNCGSPSLGNQFNLVATAKPTIDAAWVEENSGERDHLLPWYLPRVKIGYAYHRVDVEYVELGEKDIFDGRATKQFPDLDILSARAEFGEAELRAESRTVSALIKPYYRLAIYLVMIATRDTNSRFALAALGDEVTRPGEQVGFPDIFPEQVFKKGDRPVSLSR